jgi:hypothetical protein
VPRKGSASLFANVRMTHVGASWLSIRGVLKPGYGVASGPSADYPYGALVRQFPIFKSRGLDLSGLFRGTLNVDIRPRTFEMLNPELTLRNVAWTDLHPPEDFSFCRCRVWFMAGDYDGWIYFPHPETKRRNFHDPSLLEVIAGWIPGIQYGDELEVRTDPGRMLVRGAQRDR